MSHRISKTFKFRLSALNFRFRLLFLSLLVFSLTCLFILVLRTKPDVRFCFLQADEVQQMYPPKTKDNFNSALAAAVAAAASSIAGPSQPLEDILLANEKPIPGRSIFFHETSCHQPKPSGADSSVDEVLTTATNEVKLNTRQACAIESAALHNPNLDVFVLFASPVSWFNNSQQPLLEAVLSYSNVHFRNLNLWTYAAGTPIYEWLKKGDLFESHYVFSHISDFLRYLTLWRWGGTYLDLDIIMLKSIEDVPPNYTGAESAAFLAAGVMNFGPTGLGREIADDCLDDFKRNFNGRDWGNNGPGVITRVIKKKCGVESVREMLDPEKCQGFKVYDRDAFYAINWKDWEYFFEAQYLEETLARLKHSYVAHFWNNHSSQRKFKIGANVAYDKLAKDHCPRVYAAAGDYF